ESADWVEGFCGMLWDSQWVWVVCSRIEVVYAWTCPMWAARRCAGLRLPRICVEWYAYAWKMGGVWAGSE
ncbi:hypothetical protein PIB30_105327, partial [Stylosanthes scabra]|nr:hypothetical protein [Stylosanthes scabra]